MNDAAHDYVIWYEELIVRYSGYSLFHHWPFKEGGRRRRRRDITMDFEIWISFSLLFSKLMFFITPNRNLRNNVENHLLTKGFVQRQPGSYNPNIASFSLFQWFIPMVFSNVF